MTVDELKSLRAHLSAVCDEASAALDRAAPGNDQNYWGARLRLAQEIAQKIDAGDLKGREGGALAEMLAWLRSRGWMVGVHNDYRRADGLMTFWLFTHLSGRYLKGEGPSDELAVAVVVDQAKTIP